MHVCVEVLSKGVLKVEIGAIGYAPTVNFSVRHLRFSRTFKASVCMDILRGHVYVIDDDNAASSSSLGQFT